MAKNNKQYSFHLNLNNPDHLKIYRTLEDLNLDIHKSISSFVIKAVVQYINSASRSDITNAGKTEKENLEGYVTRRELEGMKLEIKAEIMKEVAQLFGNSAMNSQGAASPALMQQMMEIMAADPVRKQNEDKKKTEPEAADAALEEMSLLFAQGVFGEE
jgi:hypothetical protein